MDVRWEMPHSIHVTYALHVLYAAFDDMFDTHYGRIASAQSL